MLIEEAGRPVRQAHAGARPRTGTRKSVGVDGRRGHDRPSAVPLEVVNGNFRRRNQTVEDGEPHTVQEVIAVGFGEHLHTRDRGPRSQWLMRATS